ncbi:MAG: GTP cyclohydrolase MptA [Thermovirgaceae bacterium]
MTGDKPPEYAVYILLKAPPEGAEERILGALQYLQGRSTLAEMSSFYEISERIKDKKEDAIALVCRLQTDLSPEAFAEFINSVKKRMEEKASIREYSGFLWIKILFHEHSGKFPGKQDPCPEMTEGSPWWVPLKEIAKGFIPPGFSGRTAGELAETVPEGVLTKAKKTHGFSMERDIQLGKPRVSLSLSRVGVTNLERIIRLERKGHRSLFYAQMDLFAYLDRKHAGVHMSRFNDDIERLVEEITLESSSSIEAVAERLARRIVQSQHASRSRVNIRAKFPLKKLTPISGKKVEELYTFIGIAACHGGAVKMVIGVEVEGMTTCPCAQDMVRSNSVKLLTSRGYAAEEAKRIVDLLPTVSHNQRGRGTLLLGTNRSLAAEQLVHLVEASMSSETYELLKRPDEFYVVNKAHKNPMFAEDVVREVFRNLVDMYPDLPDETFVLARQENLESIHQHNAFAERSGTLGDIRSELSGRLPQKRQPTLEEWLGA